MPTSDFGQPIGAALPHWTPRPHPPRTSITGRFCRVDPLDTAAHAADLFACLGSIDDGRWTYLPYGPSRIVAASRGGLPASTSMPAAHNSSPCPHSCPRRLSGYDLEQEILLVSCEVFSGRMIVTDRDAFA